MKQLVMMLSLGLVLMACGGTKTFPTAAVDKLPLPEGFSKAQLDLIAETARQFPNHSEFAIALIDGNQVHYYGSRRQKNELQPIDNSTAVFEVGSISKIFTTHLFVNLYNKGTIPSVDQRISDKLGLKLLNDPPITFKQLANHSSGLPSVPSNYNPTIFTAKNPYKKYSTAKLEKNLSQQLKLHQAPGEKYVYSNYGMGLLAYTISGITNKDYESLLREQIFDPLNMQHSSARRSSIPKTLLVKPYDKNGKPTAYWDMGALAGAGAVLSSIEDLAKYAIWCFGALNASLAIMQEKTLSINEDMDIALGWHIIKNKSKTPFLWHNGGTGGFKSSMAINPLKRKSVVILTNVGATNNPKKHLIDELCYDLMKSLE